MPNMTEDKWAKSRYQRRHQ